MKIFKTISNGHLQLGYLILLFLIFLMGCQSQNLENKYRLAEKLWLNGSPAAAAEEFRKIVNLDPRGQAGIHALYRLGMLELLQLGRYREGIRDLRFFTQLSKDERERWAADLTIGDVLFSRLEDWQDAKDQFLGMLSRTKDKSEKQNLGLKIARCDYNLNFFSEAESRLIPLFKSCFDEGCSQIQFALGQVYHSWSAAKDLDSSTSIKYLEKAGQAFRYVNQSKYNSELEGASKLYEAECLFKLDRIDDAEILFHELSSLKDFSRIAQKNLLLIARKKKGHHADGIPKAR